MSGMFDSRLLVASIAAFLAVAAGVVWGVIRMRRASARYRRSFEDAVGAQLERSFLFIGPDRVFRVNLLLVVAATMAAAWLSGNLWVGVAAAVVVGFAPRWLLARMRAQRLARLRDQLPDLMLLVAAGMRAGGSLWQSLAQTAAELHNPMRQEVELMLREQRLGLSLERALDGLERRVPIEEMRLLTAAIRIAQDTGGNLAETMESLAQSARRKLALEGKVRALTAQGRMQAWVMGLLPLGLAGVLFLMEPDAMSTLFTTTLGLMVCAVLAVLLSLGVYFVRRIVAVDV